MVLNLKPAVFSFVFGRLTTDQVAALKANDIFCIGTANSLKEAKLLAKDGVDAVIVQGRAAGGHRGGWQEDHLTDTSVLTSAAARNLNIPVIATGGIMSYGDIRAALNAGASLVQCGTAFLRANEAGTSAPYRAALSSNIQTVLTRNFSGRPARGLKNAVTDAIHHPMPYPYQNALTRSMRATAVEADKSELLSLWAGEGYQQAIAAPVNLIMERLWPLT